MKPSQLVALAGALALTLNAGCGGGAGGERPPQSAGAGVNTLPLVKPIGCFAVPTANIKISASASRISGVAPLSVIFDATKTTAIGITAPFHELSYKWDFDDPTAGDWKYGVENLRSKNAATGAMAAHVFDTAGTYAVRLTVATGSTTITDTCVITVEDPDKYSGYASNKTACIGKAMPTAGNDGCPMGARIYAANELVTTVNAVIQTALAAGARRILINRGDSFTADNYIDARLVGPVTIADFGTAVNKPVIKMGKYGGYLFNLFNGPTDWRFINLDLDGLNSTVRFSSTNGSNLSDHILYYKLNIRNSAGMTVGRNNVAVVDNDIGPVFGSPCPNGVCGGVGIYAQDVFTFFFAGNNISDTTGGEHGIRIQGAKNGVVNHNTLSNAAYTKQVFTLRGNDGMNTVPNTTPYITEYIVVSDNIFQLTKATADNWLTSIAPQNNTRKEEIQNIIVERNTFSAVSDLARAMVITASDITIRNNLFNQSNVGAAIQLVYTNLASVAHSNNIKIQNNSFISMSGNAFSAISISDALVGSVSVVNNLAYSKSATVNSENNAAPSFLYLFPGVSVSESNNTSLSDLKTAPNLVNLSALSKWENWRPKSIFATSPILPLGGESDFSGNLRSKPVDLGALIHQ